KEGPHIAYQTKEEIDRNYIKLIEHRLLTANAFTSIATHDHNIINHVKQFVKNHNIDKNSFEFQMLYGFINDDTYELSVEGYYFIMYVPIGEDWFVYYIRCLEERPKNNNLMLLDRIKAKNKKIFITGAA